MGVFNFVSAASLASLSERNFTVADPPPGATDAIRYALY